MNSGWCLSVTARLIAFRGGAALNPASLNLNLRVKKTLSSSLRGDSMTSSRQITVSICIETKVSATKRFHEHVCSVYHRNIVTASAGSLISGIYSLSISTVQHRIRFFKIYQNKRNSRIVQQGRHAGSVAIYIHIQSKGIYETFFRLAGL